MPSIAISELVENARASWTTNGIMATREFLVTGLTSTTGPLLQAMTAPNLPLFGDPHPDNGLIYVSGIEPTPFAKNSRTEARVLYTYTAPSGNNLNQVIQSYSAFTREVPTNFDWEGDLIRVNYFTGANQVNLPEAIGRVSGASAEGALVLDLLLSTDPTAYIDYLNVVNDSPWRGRPPYTWWVSAVNVEKSKFQSGWQLKMVIRYREETWIRPSFYRVNGIIPADIQPLTPQDFLPYNAGNGWTTVLPRGLKLGDLNGLNNLPTSW